MVFFTKIDFIFIFFNIKMVKTLGVVLGKLDENEKELYKDYIDNDLIMSILYIVLKKDPNQKKEWYDKSLTQKYKEQLLLALNLFNIDIDKDEKKDIESINKGRYKNSDIIKKYENKIFKELKKRFIKSNVNISDLEDVIPSSRSSKNIELEETDFEELSSIVDNTIIYDSYDKVIDTKDIRKKTVDLDDDIDLAIPGSIRIDRDGKLQKVFFDVDSKSANNLSSYNHFVITQIHEIMKSRPIEIDDGIDSSGKRLFRYIKFEPIFKQAQDYPSTVKKNKSTYYTTLNARVTIINQDEIEEDSFIVPITSIPVMVRSILCKTYKLTKEELAMYDFCPDDDGGYFIASGIDKNLITQEKLALNKIITHYDKKDGSYVSKMTCATILGTRLLKIKYKESEDIMKYAYSSETQVKNNSINVLLPFQILGKALHGRYLTVEEIWEYITGFLDDIYIPRVHNKLQNTFIDLFKLTHKTVTKKDPYGKGKIQRLQTPVDIIIEHKNINNILWKKLRAEIDKNKSLRDVVDGLTEEDINEGLENATFKPYSFNRYEQYTAANGKTKYKIKTDSDIIVEKANSGTMLLEDKEKAIQNELMQNLFPQVNEKDEKKSIQKKLYMYGLMIARFSLILIGEKEPDDRDSWANKMLETPGKSLEKVFQSVWLKIISGVKRELNDDGGVKIYDVKTILKKIENNKYKNTLLDGFTGTKWGINKADNNNLVEALKRTNITDFYSYITKVIVNIDKKTKSQSLRDVQGSQMGYIDAADTPESDACGLVKRTAQLTRITIEINDYVIIEKVKDSLSNIKSDFHDTTLLLNGRFMGFCNGIYLKDFLIKQRRSLEIPEDTGIFLDQKSIKILEVNTSAGRVTRPLLVVENGKILIDEKNMREKASYEELLKEGVVEYIDSQEQTQGNVLIAESVDSLIDIQIHISEKRKDLENLKKIEILIQENKIKDILMDDELSRFLPDDNPGKFKEYIENQIKLVEKTLEISIHNSNFTHVEIDPTNIHGLASATISYSHNNPAIRVSYQCSQKKSAPGLKQGNFSHQFEKSKVLYAPEKSITATQTHEFIGLDSLPAGMNVILLIAQLGGYNQEDSIIISKSAIERGLFLFTINRTYKTTNNSPGISGKGREFEEIYTLPKFHESQRSKYSALNKDGIPELNKFVTEGDYIIGRVRRYYQDGRLLENETENISEMVPKYVKGVIDQVLISEKNVQVLLRDTRIPEEGDKFASGHAQKSTIGKVVAEIDLPRTKNGVTPDIIINPAAFPSRMTIGQLIEMLISKAVVLAGDRANSTAFRRDINTGDDGIGTSFKKALRDKGFTDTGYEVMYSGITGEAYRKKLNIAPCYYQQLKHMPVDKIQERAEGSVSMSTHQPPGGRGVNGGGGTRVGEMERDAFISHGASEIIADRLLDQSDAQKIALCTRCGVRALQKTGRDNPFKCLECGESDAIKSIKVPYPEIIVTSLLQGVGIKLGHRSK